jgi:predicted ATPase/DNA-binding SARP family transcriptional activator
MLTVHLLGQFEIRQDDEAVELPSRPAQSLLAWLILHPGIAHRREQIAGLLWPDATEENARSNLRHALWRLRRAIPDGFVQSDKIAIRWLVEADWRADVDSFSENSPQATRADDLLPALHAYRGELLPGFYDEWVIRERERLAALYSGRMARLLDLLLAEQRWRETIDGAEKWIANDHAPEPAYRALMAADAALGNPAAALAAYARCVEALDQELGVPPSAETTALAESIRNAQFRPAQPPGPPVTRSNLPAPTTPLIGRERELAHLSSLLADPKHRLVTILGPGGMGKSRLALAAGHTLRERFPDGVFLVELTALDSADEIPRSIGDALGYPFQTDSRSPQQQLLDYLSGRKVLLVLDNFEHLLAGAELLIAQLEAAPGLQILVTSRERLHLHAETLLRLNGLDYPAEGERVGEDFPFAGAQLFLQCAQRMRREFEPKEEAWPAILRICRQVDGMPLGIILAASWVEHLSPAEIADEIAANVAFLGQDLRDLDPRHRTMEAVFAQSWRRLSDEERLALMGLSIFTGGFDREAAQAVAGAGLPLLARLVDKALLWRVGEARYDLHELIRQLARQKLVETGRESGALSLHSGWYLALVARQRDALKGRAESQANQQLEKERENIRSAWQWAAANGEIDGLLAAVEVLGIFYNHPGRWAEGERLMATALNSLGEPVEPQAHLLDVWLLAWQGVLLHRIGQAGQARLHLTTALERLADGAQAAEDPLSAEEYRRVQAFAYLHRGGDLMTDRRRGETGNDLRRSLALFQQTNDRWWTIHCLVILGSWELFNGHLGRSWELCEEGLQLARQLRYPSGQIIALERMSFAAEHRGDTEAGERLAREALAMAQETSRRMVLLNRLTFALLAVGKFEESVTLAKEALDWGENIHIHIRGTAFLYNTLARGLLHLGRFAEGNAIARAAVERWQDAYGFEQPFLLRTVSRAVLARGGAPEARRLILQTVDSQQQMGNENLFALSGAYIDAAYPALALGDLDETRRMLIQGLTFAQQSEAFDYGSKGFPAAARLLALQNRLEEAAFVNGAIQRYPRLTNSRWYAAVALDRLAELLAPLPPDVRNPAEERGRTPELPEMTAELLALLA